ncbi:MAG: putative Ig domain-containing protein, partial [Thermomicrobiales bacterium]
PNPATTGSQGTAQTTATATAIAGGPYTASATVQGVAVPATFSLTNNAIPALVVALGALPNGAAGQPYPTTTFTASGGIAPYRFAVTNGTLPAGLTLDTTTSALGGTPSATGTFSFTVTATDANGFTATQQYTVTITEAEMTGIVIMAGNTSTTTLTLKIGQSSQLTVQKVFGDGSTQPLSGAQWTASDPHIARVDANGKVTGLSPGTVTITVRLNGVTLTLTITVPGQTPVGSMPVPGSRSSGATSATGSPAPVPNRSGPVSPASGGGLAPNPVPTGR